MIAVRTATLTLPSFAAWPIGPSASAGT